MACHTENPWLIALGANLARGESPPEVTLSDAVDALSRAELRVLVRSRWYRSPCWPPGAGPDYVNGVVAVADCRTRGPGAMLALLQMIEARFGRDRVIRWGARTLDLDLIACGGLVLPDAATQTRWRALPVAGQMRATPDRLILPHPRMQDRAFVLVPLLEVAPDWRHPLTGESAAEMLAALPEAERAAVQVL
ncbi:MAG: 2-amino-4-hydroxy-6-hydroxymethyldihydropteridine diphosphokinase [Gemmobacter sp.]